MTKKKTTTKKKVVKKEEGTKTKDIQLVFLKNELEHTKDVYETFCKILAKYNISNMAMTLFRCREGYNNIVMKKYRKNINSFWDDCLITVDTEEERIKTMIKYYEELIAHCRRKLKRLPDDVRLEITKEAIEYQHCYMKELGNVTEEKFKNFKQKEKKKTDKK